MILLLGGTSETAAIAGALAGAGLRVLVSTATDEALDVGRGAAIERRSGRLDEQAMLELVRAGGIGAIVDATHPYAAGAHATAQAVARRAGIPCVAFVREGGAWGCTGGAERGGDVGQCPTYPAANAAQAGKPVLPMRVHLAPDHARAAAVAFSLGRAVLLTTGANNLLPYADEARRTSIRLVARVLPREESIRACREAGVGPGDTIAARGPFSVEQNILHIDEYGIGTLVTKDSGREGGVDAKLQAARRRGCAVVVVGRPPRPEGYVSCVSAIAEIPDRLRSLGVW
jgi:precorrin-6A/cobalt-precorrin-6A reductase